MILKKELYLADYVILSAFGLLMLSGLISNELIGYQGIKVALSDGVIVSKFIVSYFFGRLCFKSSDVDSLLLYLRTAIKGVTVMLFVCLLLNLVLPLWPSYDSRFGYTVQTLMFSHPTYLTSTAAFGLLFLSVKPRQNDLIYIVMNLLLIILAARNKGLIFVGIYVFILVRQSQKKRTSVWSLVGISAMLYVLFQNTIASRLFSSETAARSTLYKNGFGLAARYFPFGAGLGTYGSSASIKNYSPLYSELGFNQLYGFSEATTYYLTDTFIAMVLGQFGYVGVFLLSVILLSMFILLRKNQKYENFSLLLFIFIFISMITENFISSSYGVLSFFLVGILVNQTKVENEKEVSL